MDETGPAWLTEAKDRDPAKIIGLATEPRRVVTATPSPGTVAATIIGRVTKAVGVGEATVGRPAGARRGDGDASGAASAAF